MIVEFWINGQMGRASTPGEVEIAISRTLTELESERKVPVGFDPGTTASFHVFDLPAGAAVPNSLTVGINRTTGYGGMIWWGEQIPEHPEQFYWVTRSGQPPDVDPRVTADPCFPLWYDKRNVVPMQKVKDALEEFCFNLGRRPAAVE
ncbi:hypothetical protein GCM10010294_69600 [Streptomyces griseoloalbus]|uniref:Imm1 family immunity protein n=1 Tax=Streptomyces griseoloalbus TaxID=67303 RepID=UPI00187670D3|nr:hypothetical protein GCM10010294_69600 [Streptomyces griseoloalbus]